MDCNDILLLPKPQTLRWLEGCYKRKHESVLTLCPPTALAAAAQTAQAVFGGTMRLGNCSEVAFCEDASIPGEGCRLRILPSGITLAYSAAAGAFYGLATLHQLLLQCGDALPCCEIDDAPALQTRGILLDISRNKIPKPETLCRIADFMAAHKMNHLELYIEGFSFAYPSFSAFWADETPLTGAEIEAFDQYCRARFIDLVPNQNCLGHMAPWLEKPGLRHLAELERGLSIMGHSFPPTTLNPLDGEGLALVEQMTADLLPHFSSGYFNVNLDEPFELGKGKSQALCEEVGLGRVYLEYAKKIHALTLRHNKKMLMWGDIIAKHPDIIGDIPGDITILEWGYEAEHPFAKRAQVLQQAGLPFFLCPGTSTWTSFTGITDNMIANITCAAKAAHTYGAQGLVIADWGDSGHLQYLPVSLPALLFGAACAWNRSVPAEGELACALNRFIFFDQAEVMGQFCLDAGRYSRLEEFLFPCKTLAVFPLIFGMLPAQQLDAAMGMLLQAFAPTMVEEVAAVYQANYEGRKAFEYAPLAQYLQQMEDMLQKSRMRCPGSKTILEQYQNALHMVQVLQQIRNMIMSAEQMAAEEELAQRSEIAQKIVAVMAEHRRLWLLCNKPGGLEQSLQGFGRLLEQVQ